MTKDRVSLTKGPLDTSKETKKKIQINEYASILSLLR